jgi:hypothetical protein
MSKDGQAAAAEELERLDARANDLDEEMQSAAAAVLWRHATEAAEAAGDHANAVTYRLSWTLAQARAGQFGEAIAILAPVVAPNSSVPPEDVYRAHSLAFAVAVHLPARLAAIREAASRAEAYLRAIGHLEWRHRLLLDQSALHRYRGIPAAALASAQEGLALWSEEHPRRYVRWLHRLALVRSAIMLRDTRLVEHYIRQWVELDPPETADARSKLISAQMWLYRLQGRPQDALDLAGEAQVRGWPQGTALSIFLLTHADGHARTALVATLPKRRSECGYERYDTYQLLGDYHLAMARRAIGAPTVDDDLDTTYQPGPRPTDFREATVYLRRANRAYQAANKEATELDGRLETTAWTRELDSHLRRVRELAADVGEELTLLDGTAE